MNTSNIIWGFHSESEDELVGMISCVARGNQAHWAILELFFWIKLFCTILERTSNLVLKILYELMGEKTFVDSILNLSHVLSQA